MTTEITTIEQPLEKEEKFSVFASSAGFELAQRMAACLSKATFTPEIFRNNVSNCLIALELSNRLNMSVIMVMQNLHIIQGKPSWSSQFITALINNSGLFKTNLRYKISGEGNKKQCIAFAEDKDGNICESPAISLEMAAKEGWSTKTNSKWINLSDLMLRYRAAAFFGRLYCPEILLGLHSQDELIDIIPPTALDTQPGKQPDLIEIDEISDILNSISPELTEINAIQTL